MMMKLFEQQGGRRRKLGDASSNQGVHQKKSNDKTIGRLILAVFVVVAALSLVGMLKALRGAASTNTDNDKRRGVMSSLSSSSSSSHHSSSNSRRGRRGNVNVEEPSLLAELLTSISEERLNAIADKYRQEYAKALPFPHIVIDGLFPKHFLEAVELETREDKYYDRNATNNNNDETKTKCVKGHAFCFTEKIEQRFKSSIEKEENMGPYTRLLFMVMKTSNFISFLERLTQIEGILPDPHYHGSGLHFTTDGGFLDIHADFNKYQRFQLDRRVNAFVFLNNDWKEEYGGHLELWNREMTQCSKRVLPTLGRFLVFSTTDFSYHGHPNALTAPPGRARRSVALYYYSNGRPSHECWNGDCSGEGHTTLFKKPKGCTRCEEQSCRAYTEGEQIPWMDQ